MLHDSTYMASGKGSTVGGAGAGRGVRRLLCNLMNLYTTPHLSNELTFHRIILKNAGVIKRKLALGVQNTQGRISSSCRNTALVRYLTSLSLSFLIC